MIGLSFFGVVVYQAFFVLGIDRTTEAAIFLDGHRDGRAYKCEAEE